MHDPVADYRAAVDRSMDFVAGHYLHLMHEPARSAAEYALRGGGKRLRGMLLVAAYEAAGGRGDAVRLAAAVEIIHAYSLVHDDLPCMDNDDVRRGRATLHRVHGEAVAAVAGAAMIPLAARVAYDGAAALQLPRERCCTIVRVLMNAAGATGMIGGQLLDLQAEGESLSREELDRVHTCKTGALISASLRVGGLAAGAEAGRLEALSGFGARIGLAFQIMDDVLDVTSSMALLGKTIGRDAALRKSTYPALLGVEQATGQAERLVDEGVDLLRDAGLLTIGLERLGRFVAARTH